jgi:hypothetical protein
MSFSVGVGGEPGYLSGTELGYGLDDQVFESQRGGWEFSLPNRVQNSSGAHPASYPVGTRGFFLGSKAVAA